MYLFMFVCLFVCVTFIVLTRLDPLLPLAWTRLSSLSSLPPSPYLGLIVRACVRSLPFLPPPSFIVLSCFLRLQVFSSLLPPSLSPSLFLSGFVVVILFRLAKQ